MAIEEIQQLFAQFKDYMQGANFFAPIIINLTSDSASNVVNCADVAEKKEPEQQNIGEEVSQALREITGEHNPIDCKQKWAGAYWYLRWAYNFPVDVQEFCNKIQELPCADELEVSCNYENIRKFATLSFMEQDLLISLYRYQAYHCNRYHSSAAIGTARIAAIGTKFIGSA